MKESVQAAHSYTRARAELLGIHPSLFDEYDLHIHFPEGAVPKDGPSAGLTIVMAIASALAEAPLRNDVAMTGEVTLRGKVLGVGGLKEKVMAAYRAGIRTVVFPVDNQKDLVEIPQTVRDKMNFLAVSTVDEVFQHAFVGVAERIAELEAKQAAAAARAKKRKAARAKAARKKSGRSAGRAKTRKAAQGRAAKNGRGARAKLKRAAKAR
jgi:ATP-dependent Lon protease